MPPTEVIFMAFGEAPGILQLADTLTGEIQQCVSRSTGTNSEPVTTHSFIVKLPLSGESDEAILDQTNNWLKEHAAILSPLSANKTIEFQTFLGSDMGSRILTIPHAIVSTCGDLGLNIANQAIRVLSPEEFAAIRAKR